MPNKLPPITDVSISTVTVDIQVIRIGAKQMTLAVFRQLPYKSIIDECGNLLELPWGWVNYDRDRDQSTPFVFSHHATLYRSDVNISAHRQLVINPEMQMEDDPKGAFTAYGRREKKQVPTGRYVMQTKDRFSGYQIYLVFQNEDGARGHLQNRLASIAILETAPQLFIAV